MDCYCDYDDAPTAFNEGPQKAKKQHKCSECGGNIRPGETYTKTWGVWDGSVCTFKRCTDCQSFLDWALAHVKCICWSYGEMHQDVLDELHGWDRDCPGLYAEARAKVMEIRERRRQPVGGSDA